MSTTNPRRSRGLPALEITTSSSTRTWHSSSPAQAIKQNQIHHKQRNRDRAPDRGRIALHQRALADIEILGVGPAQVFRELRKRLGAPRGILVHGLGQRGVDPWRHRIIEPCRRNVGEPTYVARAGKPSAVWQRAG